MTRLGVRNANYWLNIAEANEYLCFKFSDEVEWKPHDLASLALDGYPCPPTRRKLPACTPVFKKGMPF